MKIIDLLDDRSILLDGRVADKKAALDQMVELMDASGKLRDKETYRQGVYAREQEGSTGIGEGIAIPHCKSDAVIKPGLAAMVVKDGVEFESLDGQPAHLFFLIAAPNTEDNVHLDVLSRLSVLLMDEDFTNKLRQAASVSEFKQIIEDAEKSSENEGDTSVERADSEHYIVAVTGCPTGIAHTYMAAEALEKAGKKLGISIKVETNGSGGAKNILTDKEIAECDGIIVAADKSVEMARFNGKKVLSTKVSDGIKIPEELIGRIEKGDAPVYHHEGGAASSSLSSANESFGRKIYKHLMNGVSNMLPFTVAGGIFIAIAFLIDTLMGVQPGDNFGTVTPVAAFFKTIGGYAFNFMIPVLAGYIGKSIADRPGFLVGLVGGYLATTGSTFVKIGGDVPSGFLGALFAGFVGGFIMLGLEKLCDKMPKALNGIKPVLIYPLAGLGIIAVVMCAINPFMGIINTAIADFLNHMGAESKIFLGVILGAMMSIDMGGPFNKAAYVFGTAAIATGGYDIMAAVMIGGMVPPIAIALSTTFFKSRWTEEERKNGPVNYIMGLSFITEGAIPYAAADPIRVIPACMVGAGVAGGLSMAFNCTLMAPHGGIFVFAVVGNWPMYLVSLAVGAVVSMLLLALLKKKKTVKEPEAK